MIFITELRTKRKRKTEGNSYITLNSNRKKKEQRWDFLSEANEFSQVWRQVQKEAAPGDEIEDKFHLNI